MKPKADKPKGGAKNPVGRPKHVARYFEGDAAKANFSGTMRAILSVSSDGKKAAK